MTILPKKVSLAILGYFALLQLFFFGGYYYSLKTSPNGQLLKPFLGISETEATISAKVVEEEVKSYIFNQVSKEKKKELIDGIDKVGRVKISDIDKAQQRIVALIRGMEENGEIIVCRPDEIVE